MNDMNEDKAREILGDSFIGSERIISCAGFPLKMDDIPDIPFTENEIREKKETHLLILGLDSFVDGSPVTIKKMKERFGMDPSVSEPCFYNQDWYDHESFVDMPMKKEWYFIRKEVYEDSRAVQPDILLSQYRMPSAVKCVYSFFVSWFTLGIRLWEHDFVWCNDLDHNGDRIYVGKYHDVDGINKNGFSIHRHLALRNCYGCID